MEISRNQQHYIVMTVIYNELTDYSIGGGETFRDAKELISSLCEMMYEDVPSYIKETVSCSLNKYGEIRNAFIPKLKSWTWERIPLLSQAILIMSYAHFYYVEKVAKGVVINVAVELAKKYIEEKQAKFINGILNEVLN